MLRMINLKDHGLLTVLALPEWNERIEEKMIPADWAVMANIVTTLKVSWDRLKALRVLSVKHISC